MHGLDIKKKSSQREGKKLTKGKYKKRGGACLSLPSPFPSSLSFPFLASDVDNDDDDVMSANAYPGAAACLSIKQNDVKPR